MLTEEVEEVLVDGKDGYDKIKKISKNILPTNLKKLNYLKKRKLIICFTKY